MELCSSENEKNAHPHLSSKIMSMIRNSLEGLFLTAGNKSFRSIAFFKFKSNALCSPYLKLRAVVKWAWMFSKIFFDSWTSYATSSPSQTLWVVKAADGMTKQLVSCQIFRGTRRTLRKSLGTGLFWGLFAGGEDDFEGC